VVRHKADFYFLPNAAPINKGEIMDRLQSESCFKAARYLKRKSQIKTKNCLKECIEEVDIPKCLFKVAIYLVAIYFAALTLLIFLPKVQNVIRWVQSLIF